MILGIVGDNSGIYQFVALLHVLLAIAAFGPTFAFVIMGKRASEVKGAEGLHLTRSTVQVSSALVTPGAWATGVLGVVLVAMSDVFEFSDLWVTIAFVLFGLGIANSYVNLQPTAKRMLALQEELAAMGPPPEGAAPSGPPPQVLEMEALGKKMPMYSGIAHLLIVALVWVMIVKPGWP